MKLLCTYTDLYVVAATRSGEEAVVAPGAENVGQAQIVTEFSKPFELEGLFGAADAGAFGGRTNDDVPMADEDGDIFWDAPEIPDAMDEDLCVFSFLYFPCSDTPACWIRAPMESDDLRPVVPRKRSHSPSELSVAPAGPNDMVADGDLSRYMRQPKRQRKSKDIPDYNAPPDQHVLEQMGKSNPLNRRSLKKEAKRVRKAHRVRTVQGGAGGTMEIDDEGLQFSFMA